jgi:thiol-disulfide isomerase/thioredoxin
MVKSTYMALATLTVALLVASAALAQPPKTSPNSGRRSAPTPPTAPTGPAANPAPAPPPAAAKPTPAEALKLQPIQTGVDYDVPDQSATEKCTLAAVKTPLVSGWEVRDSSDTVLRRFLDTNGDNKIDQWCYYQDGVEVYRDIDSNFNRKVDAYRWLGTAGIRWALDPNEDGRIDRWKVLSPEELSEEMVGALSGRDAERFRCLLLTKEELASLRLGKDRAAELDKKLTEASSQLEEYVRTQEIVKPEARWVNFGATRPGLVAAGTDDLEQDLQVYENAVAVIESEGTHDQIMLGTLIRVGDAWRMIGLPRSISDTQATAASDGFFFRSALAQHGAMDEPATGGLSKEVQDLVSGLEQIDRDLSAAATPAASAPLHAQKAALLQKLADKATDANEKAAWIRQMADALSASAQAGGSPAGIQQLAALCQQLQADNAAPELASYVKFLFLTADYTQAMQAPNADYPKVQQKWRADLEQFVKDFGTTEDVAEAMLQLAIVDEFDGQDEKAIGWYGRITSEFPNSPRAIKAVGAKRRLESVGKPLEFEGKDTDGNPVSIAALRGKVVIIHYWATLHDQCKLDISVLKDMQAKYGKNKVALIGVNLDSARADFDAYLQRNPLPWPQLYEAGGLDSPLANALGVLALPTMLLIDQDGKVVDRNLHIEKVDEALGGLVH